MDFKSLPDEIILGEILQDFNIYELAKLMEINRKIRDLIYPDYIEKKEITDKEKELLIKTSMVYVFQSRRTNKVTIKFPEFDEYIDSVIISFESEKKSLHSSNNDELFNLIMSDDELTFMVVLKWVNREKYPGPKIRDQTSESRKQIGGIRKQTWAGAPSDVYYILKIIFPNTYEHDISGADSTFMKIQAEFSMYK